MSTVNDIYSVLTDWAPEELAVDWDNVGLQIGDKDAAVERVLVAMDVDTAVLGVVESGDVDVVITHHPLFFMPIKNLDFSTDLGRIVRTFVQNNCALISAHTNLDLAVGGVNDQLILHYGLDPEKGAPFDCEFGKYFTLESSRSVDDFLSGGGGRLCGATTKTEVGKVGFCAGSGKSMVKELVPKGIELFITGELGYHDEVFCELNGIAVILLGHKESEQFVLPEIQSRLQQKLPDLVVTL